MLQKKWIAAALLATAAVSTTASAGDRGVNTALGAVAGALIGNSVGGQDAAVIGGLLGAVVGNTLTDNDEGRRHARRSGYAAPVYYRQPAQARPYYREVRSVRYAPSYRDAGRGNYRYDRYDYRR